MTADISIGNYRNIRPSEVQWHCSVANFTDSCSITLPLSSYVRSSDSSTDCPFRMGDKADVKLGYDGENIRVFSGFVSRINMGEALVIECEGYSYGLRNRKFKRSYRSTTVKGLLSDLTAGTGIRLSDRTDDIRIDNVTFNNTPGLKVLEWLQKECACRVYFNFDTLYAGASQYTIDNGSIDIEIGYNTVSADELKKNTDESVQINIVEKDSAGKVRRIKPEEHKYSDIKEVKVRQGLPADYLRRALKELQDDENAKGYEGSITLFLQPHADKGTVCNITDRRFPERSGQYFVEEINGSFGSGGGRQNLKLKNYGHVR